MEAAGEACFVTVCQMNGEHVEMEVQPMALCSELKCRLAQRLGVHRFQVELLHGPEVVKDNVLQSTLVSSDATVSTTVTPFLSEGMINELIERMRGVGVEFGPGLTDDEIAMAERVCRIQFPPDLKAFLQAAMPSPSADGFIDWRSVGPETNFQDRALEHLLEAMVEKTLWWPAWGATPSIEDNAEFRRKVERELHNVPRLIPIYSHRYMACTPQQAGQPVLSILGADIISYGTDLAAYLAREFDFEPVRETLETSAVTIPFWSNISDGGEMRNLKKEEEDKMCRIDAFGSDDLVCSDRAVALTGVAKRGDALQFVSEELKADPAVVLASVATNSSAMYHAAQCLREDSAFAVQAVGINAGVFYALDAAVQTDRAVVLAALQSLAAGTSDDPVEDFVEDYFEACGVQEVEDLDDHELVAAYEAASAKLINKG